MHRASHADRALELATPASDRAAVLGPNKLGMHIGGEEWPLHELNIANHISSGNVLVCEMQNRQEVFSGAETSVSERRHDCRCGQKLQLRK